MSSPSVAPSDIGEDENSLFDFVDIDANGTNSVQATLMDQDINSNEHARQRRELLDLIIRLQAIGLGTELALPQIACIGSQSVGKSSLIESISGVALPRASGTCTRCPIECRLKHSEQAWEAVVYLRFESGKSGYVGKTKEVQFVGPCYGYGALDDYSMAIDVDAEYSWPPSQTNHTAPHLQITFDSNLTGQMSQELQEYFDRTLHEHGGFWMP
ncbi:hypothetical protein RSOLAG22IIIB_08815 [Rhizoctonia solani]|uniref:Dynamin N-terminal domain-containing protein n=1 Tax=Rhizoctonia solani TaxID=456999 RepID=A0A0K6FUL8_9AGAM|nr:hypothetical protein RSOLAG22IIIB_08815 [Rhizoctonia solani]